MKKILLCFMFLVSSLCFAGEYSGGIPENHNNHIHYITEANSTEEVTELFKNKVYYFNKYYKSVGYDEFEQNGITCRIAVFTSKSNPDIYYFVIQYGYLLVYASRVEKGDCDLIPEFK